MNLRIWVVSTAAALALVTAGCVAQTASPGPAGLSATPAGSASTAAIAAKPTPTAAASPAITGSGAAAEIESLVESIYTQVNPSVVNIQVLLPATSSSFSGIPNLPGLPPGYPGATPTPGAPGNSGPVNSALGSGLVFDTAGDIVTNNHVVDGASRIMVTFYDGTTVDATLVGTDPDSDLAVIKVDPATAPQLVPIKIADSTPVKVGQLAIAIGNPFGLQGTMTVGFISALGRVIPTNQSGVGPSYSIPDIIQTDAPINPGNSGGALLDDTGSLVGVTYMIDTQSGSNSGVGFAIPSSIVSQVVPALIKSGHYDHPYLGISITSLDPDLAAAMNLPASQRGALVETVVAGGPADKAGIQGSSKQVSINGSNVTVGGDVITAYNGQTVKTSDDLISDLANSGVIGQSASLTVLRNGKSVQVQVSVGARPTAGGSASATPTTTP